MNKERITAILTAAVIGVWLLAIFIKPAAAPALTPVVFAIIGYWFQVAKKNGTTA